MALLNYFQQPALVDPVSTATSNPVSNYFSTLPPPRTIADDVLNPPADWIPKSANIPSYQEWLAAQGPNYQPKGDNTPEYEYANQFFQLPTNNGDWLTLAPTVIGALMTGGALAGALPAAGAAGAAGATGGAAGGFAAADAAGLAAMGAEAGLSGAALDAFVASGGTLGSTAAGAAGAAGGVLGGPGVPGSGTISTGGFGGAATTQSTAPAALPQGMGGFGGIFSGITGSSLLSGALQGGLGYLGADKQADAYRDVANQNLAIGAPYRNTLQASYQPGFDLMSQPGYGDAFNRMADISARSYSGTFGNPAENPTAQAGILSDVWNQSYLPALSNYRGQLGQFGGLGLNTAGAAQLGGAQNAGAGYNAIGYGIGTALNPQPSFQDTLRMMQQYGMTPNYNLNVGGMRLT